MLLFDVCFDDELPLLLLFPDPLVGVAVVAVVVAAAGVLLDLLLLLLPFGRKSNILGVVACVLFVPRPLEVLCPPLLE